ncbi:M20/M25/M40 family metallo-hydrolase, partial [Haladaptatus sp.]|uniref:M20/M25/M40 family metallo-hydrolase n=1 Tax=Haladaptatus sp. TaxID=1973141 RepID=UPI003C49B281
HAGGKPEAGKSAIAALATAVENLHAIPRHSGGITRVNVGTIEGGTATNVIPERATLTAEARGETNELWEYMRERVESVIDGAADVHDCQVDLEFGTVLPTARSDDCIVDVVEAVSRETSGVRETATYPDPTGSEDATFLMRAVQENGGEAAYVGIGTNHPGDHHSATFDVDEESIPIGIRVVEGTVRELARTRP